jgi:hypothetical protein
MKVKHWKTFAAFVQAELKTGGPDPQIAIIAWLGEKLTPAQRVWLAGCYAAHHCVPSAVAVFTEFPDPKEIVAHPERLKIWLKKHWKYLPVRNEMRSHRMLAKRHACLLGFAKYAFNESWRVGTYDDLWRRSIDAVPYYNRYMAIKYLEMLRRMVRRDMGHMPDMRAKGGWSPRRTVAMLWPKVPELADRDDESPPTIQTVELYVRRTQRRLKLHYDTHVSLFQLQVLLCEYREALNGGYYPGASHDEELTFMAKVAERFPEPDGAVDRVLTARSKLFKRRYLGEVSGWIGVREEKFKPFKLKGRH